MFSILVAMILTAPRTMAAVEPIQVGLKKTDRYVTSGLLVGGEHQRDVALTDLRRQYSSKTKLERIVLEMKSLANSSKTPTGRASFFQVNVNTSNNNVTVDISGMSGAHLPLNDISKLLEKSPLISKAEFIVDPEDHSSLLTLQLKKPGLKVEAFELSSKDSGRLVIDLKE